MVHPSNHFSIESLGFSGNLVVNAFFKHG